MLTACAGVDAGGADNAEEEEEYDLDVREMINQTCVLHAIELWYEKNNLMTMHNI